MPERIAAGRRPQIHACSHTWSATAQPHRQCVHRQLPGRPPAGLLRFPV